MNRHLASRVSSRARIPTLSSGPDLGTVQRATWSIMRSLAMDPPATGHDLLLRLAAPGLPEVPGSGVVSAVVVPVLSNAVVRAVAAGAKAVAAGAKAVAAGAKAIAARDMPVAAGTTLVAAGASVGAGEAMAITAGALIVAAGATFLAAGTSVGAKAVAAGATVVAAGAMVIAAGALVVTAGTGTSPQSHGLPHPPEMSAFPPVPDTPVLYQSHSRGPSHHWQRRGPG